MGDKSVYWVNFKILELYRFIYQWLIWEYV